MKYKNRDTEPMVDDIVGYRYSTQDDELMFKSGIVVGKEDNGSIKIVTLENYRGGWEADFDWLMPNSVYLLHRQDELDFNFRGVK